MKEKKRKVFEEHHTPYEEMLDAVIDARENNPTVIPQPVIPFTPGVPTEDGWYVVKSQRNEYTFYETIIMSNGICITGYDGEILSHAKLPEL